MVEQPVHAGVDANGPMEEVLAGLVLNQYCGEARHSVTLGKGSDLPVPKGKVLHPHTL